MGKQDFRLSVLKFVEKTEKIARLILVNRICKHAHAFYQASISTKYNNYISTNKIAIFCEILSTN